MPADSSLPDVIVDENQLEEVMSRPTERLVEMMRSLPGDIIILGIGGKMGATLGMQAVRAISQAGVSKRVIGVSRFSDSAAQAKLDAAGIETAACDLLDADSVLSLPDAPNVIMMAGRKFGTAGSESVTWATNTIVPANVARRFYGSRIVLFSTGCVYPFVTPDSGACTESTTPEPVGEYAQSCLARERIFEYYCGENQTPGCIFRLNYAIDLRYGVLHDIAQNVWNEQPVQRSMGWFNAIWQGEATARALLCLAHCAVPCSIMNVTGPETVSTTDAAEEFGKLLNRKVSFAGTPSSDAYLSNAAKSFELFGKPAVPMQTMIKWTAHWVKSGGKSLGRPTHFEVNDGKF